MFAAYGWDARLSDEQLIEKLVALNAERPAHVPRLLPTARARLRKAAEAP